MQETRSEGMPTTPMRSEQSHGAPVAFEEAYLRFAPLLRKIAVRRYGIPLVEAEPLVHDVFATYFSNANEVNAVEPYLVGGICNAARHYLRRAGAANALFCGETPCAATPSDAFIYEVERKILLSRVLARIGPRCRDVLHRYYMNGETTESIACTLQYKPATILIFLSKCRKRALSVYHSMTEKAGP